MAEHKAALVTCCTPGFLLIELLVTLTMSAILAMLCAHFLVQTVIIVSRAHQLESALNQALSTRDAFRAGLIQSVEIDSAYDVHYKKSKSVMPTYESDEVTVNWSESGILKRHISLKGGVWSAATV